MRRSPALASLLPWIAAAALLLPQADKHSRYVSAHDTGGYAHDDPPLGNGTNGTSSAPRVVSRSADTACATTDTELLPLYERTLFRDLDAWRLGAPYTRDHFKALIQAGADRYGGERIVLIRNGTWFYPLHTDPASILFDPIAPDGSGAFTANGVTTWVSATHWYFNHFARAWGIEFPDCVFHFDVNDTPFCGDGRACPAPSFAFWKERRPYPGAPAGVPGVPGAPGVGGPWAQAASPDILVPHMIGANHTLYDFPWDLKAERPFFRGRGNDHPVRVGGGTGTGTGAGAGAGGNGVAPQGGGVVLPRAFLANLSAAQAREGAAEPRLDVALLGPDGQGEVSIRDHAKHKFLLALDGITGSFRLSRLMHCNSAVLKQRSPWVEFFYPALDEGTHFVSVLDQSADDAVRVAKELLADPPRAQRLANASQAFAARNLCPRARMLYMRRALLEYKRLFAPGEMDAYIRDELWPGVVSRLPPAAAANLTSPG